jgi:hypothetical protein
MTIQPLPTAYVLGQVSLAGRELLWGYDHGWISWDCLTEFATRQLVSKNSNSMAEVELAGLLPIEAYRARDLAEELADNEPPMSEEAVREKWLYLILRWIFENRQRTVEPFAIVEALYADFGYPHEIARFVRYMPPEDQYDPWEHSKAENEEHMLKQWRGYLIEAEKKFGFGQD